MSFSEIRPNFFMQNNIEKAISALESEIEAVKKRPSKEILYSGELKERNGAKDFYVKFDHVIQSLKFVESCKATIGDKEFKVKPIDIEENSMTLSFDSMPKMGFEKVNLEWENDFILKKTLERVCATKGKSETGLLNALFAPEAFFKDEVPEWEVYEDGTRNSAQFKSIEKALHHPVTFVWGPPGTGKTSTLGFIIANYLLHGKKVLFASNTNRAVDVGLSSILDALDALQAEANPFRIVRFGDLALENPYLERFSFDTFLEKKKEDKKAQAVGFKQLLDELKNLEINIKDLLDLEKPIPDLLEHQLIRAQDSVKALGGVEGLEFKIANADNLYEKRELLRFQCICTTLAKVCTTELLDDVQFDAIVVDEASMANLPYLMVLAEKSSKHLVLVGDPMQLPPIALTDNEEQRAYLEKDIFTWLSGADSTNALFQWHDKWPQFTSFFDTQYRLNLDLANLVSTTFYEGRLKTAGKIERPQGKTSFQIVDSSDSNPFIEKKEGEGFKPINKVHSTKAVKLIQDLRFKGFREEEIGIIVPFRSVVWDYRKHLRTAGLGNVEVGTIHTFQGREKDVIIFDTVMSKEGNQAMGRHYTVRPFDERKSGLQVPRLLNVAFSRSKDRFYVIADMDHIRKTYKNLFLGRLLTKMWELQVV